MMSNALYDRLKKLIEELGQEGGLISPSVYDTAQVCLLAPISESLSETLDWLISQQQSDGGWGYSYAPRTRDVPTLAALLALHQRGGDAARDRVRAGLDFLDRNAQYWSGRIPDDLPVGAELVLPYLLEEVKEAGLKVDPAPYAAVIEMGNQRRRKLGTMAIRGGSTPAHSWESFGIHPNPELIDGNQSVSHNPAATAAWLRKTAGRTDLAELRASAETYLKKAAESLEFKSPGVVPGVWPLVRFEQTFSLYSLCVAGLLGHPVLKDAVLEQMRDLMVGMRPEGVGLSDHFVADGDDTATTIATALALGQPTDLAPLLRFEDGDHFCAYKGELHPSLSLTAHATYAMTMAGRDVTHLLGYIVKNQQPDGLWLNDKWHCSWLYSTSRAMIVLSLNRGHHTDALRRAVEALLSRQHADGGWGIQGSSTEETAYAILALRNVAMCGELPPLGMGAMQRAQDWMVNHIEAQDRIPLWIGKELYAPLRIVRTFELAAILFPWTALRSDNALLGGRGAGDQALTVTAS